MSQRPRASTLTLSTLTLAISAVAVIGGLSHEASGQGVIGLFDGEASFERLGQAVTTVGDLDGDGFRDFVVSAPGSGGGVGRLVVFSGKTHGTLLDVAGQSIGDEFSFSIAGIGDVDLDGFPDLVAGSPWSNAGGSLSGQIEYRSGKNGTSMGAVNGVGADSFFGFAVSAAGDLNGDGREDVLVGAPGITSYASVISGSDLANLHTFNGAVASATGSSVSGGTDVTGDGVPDLLVGASTEAIFTPGVLGLGKARVYSGADYSVVHLFLPVVNSRLGESALLVGDLNDDGKGEILVSSGVQISATEVLRHRLEVFDGLTGSVLYSVVGATSPKDDVGFAMAVIEDVTGDGVIDIVSGAPNHETSFGKPFGAVRILNGATGVEYVRMTGDGLGDQFGHGVASAGDVNGDGVTDLLIGAPLDDDGGFAAGRAFVMSVVDLAVPETPVILGDKVIGTTNVITKVHRFPFCALKGSTFKLKASGGSDSMIPRFTLRNDQDQAVQVWTIPSSASNVKLSTVLPYSGDYSLEVDGVGLTFGSYTVKTNRKLPGAAKDQKKKLKGLASHKLFFDGLPGGSASIRIKPKGGPAEFSIRLFAPGGGEIDISEITFTQASGKVVVPSVLMPDLGTYTFEINDVVETNTLFKVKIKLFQPKGAATYVVDG